MTKSLLAPTEDRSYFLNKKEGKHGVFFSKNLTPNEGRNYLTVNIGDDGSLSTISLAGGPSAVFKENSNGNGYNTILEGYRIFAKAKTTKFGPTIMVDVVENKPKEATTEEDVAKVFAKAAAAEVVLSSNSFNESSKKQYGSSESESKASSEGSAASFRK